MIKKISIRIFSNIISTSDHQSNVSNVDKKKSLLSYALRDFKNDVNSSGSKRVVRVGTWNIQVFEIQTERNLVFQTE